MKERLGLQKGKSDWGELWQSTDGKGSNLRPLLSASVDELDSMCRLINSNTKSRRMVVAIDAYFFLSEGLA